MAQEIVEVRTTIDSKEGAEVLARALVEARAAACAQVVGPIQSCYRWEGALETAEEWLVLVKTRRDRLGAVEAVIAERHPYEVPELIALPVVWGTAAYARWVEEETGAV
ncbi:MAG: divalent-cation tolerance protein CutA [Chloroflexi bacterium]|nr:divalent-cation tolerance protein CutA [Chloroflexota bacterium]